jgi:hypothetical protein
MVYSLVVVQPRAARFFERSDDHERFAAALAAGARAKVLALCAALALSGAGLVATDLTEADDPDALWLALVGAKVVLLAIGIALFVWVSWRLWPLRVLALPAELAAVRRRFARVGLALTAVVAAGLVLGAVADSVR